MTFRRVERPGAAEKLLEQRFSGNPAPFVWFGGQDDAVSAVAQGMDLHRAAARQARGIAPPFGQRALTHPGNGHRV